jgi:hypothetical protein
MPEQQPRVKSAKERDEELDTVVDEIVRIKGRLVTRGFTEQQALEMARAVVPMGICNTGNQCIAAT